MKNYSLTRIEWPHGLIYIGKNKRDCQYIIFQATRSKFILSLKVDLNYQFVLTIYIFFLQFPVRHVYFYRTF